MQTEEIPAGTIVVGVDGSRSSDLALEWAVEEARAERRPLTIVHAAGPVGAVWMDPEAFDTRIGLEGAETYAHGLVDRARASVEERAPGVEVHDFVRVADPRDVLLGLSHDAAMLVVGSRGRGSLRSLLLGSVSVAVTRHATCPVVVLRPANPEFMRHGVLVGVDATERSQAPLEFAFRQASRRGLPLTVLHAFHDVVASVTDAHLVDGLSAEYEEQRLAVAEAIAGMGTKYPEVPVQTRLARGYAGDSLVRMSERMSLVVVGAHHGGAASEIMFGSAAAAVVEHAKCPVAVVPTGGPR